MGRKSKQEKDLQAEWDERLRQAGLSMEKGRNRKLSYVGGNRALDVVEETMVSGRQRKRQNSVENLK